MLRSVVVCLCALLAIFAFISSRHTTVGFRKYPNRIPVRFWHMWSAEWKDVVDRIVDRYNRSQDKYEVIALSVPSGGDAKFLLGAMGGDPPDVMAQWNPVIPTWAEGKMLTPFEDLMSPAELKRFNEVAYPVVKEIGRYKGKTYGIAIGLNMLELYYLPSALREAGISRPPATWDELVADSSKLTKRDANGTITRLGFLPGSWMNTIPLFGGGLYDFNRGKLSLDAPQNLACLEAIVSLMKTDGYDAVQRFKSGLNTNSAAGGWPFIDGSYAMDMDGQWYVEQLAKYAPNLQYATAPMPPPPGGKVGACLSNGNFMVVPSSARQKAGAWDFIKFWSGLDDPDTAADFYVWGGWLPLSDEVARAPAYQKYMRENPQFKTFADAVRSADVQSQPPVAYQQFISDTVGRVDDLAERGTISPQEAMKELVTLVQQEVKRRKELGYDE